MIVGVGIDLVDKVAFRASIRHYGDRFINRLFTAEELAGVCGRVDSFGLCARAFACKEAAMKALGTGWTDEVDWKVVEVLHIAARRPLLNLRGHAATVADRIGAVRSWVSTAETEAFAVAQVVLEG